MHCIFCAILAGGAKSDRRLGENVQMQCGEIVQTVKSCIHSECHCANCTWIVQISKGCSVSGRLCCTASSPGKGCSIGVQRTAAASSGKASAARVRVPQLSYRRKIRRSHPRLSSRSPTRHWGHLRRNWLYAAGSVPAGWAATARGSAGAFRSYPAGMTPPCRQSPRWGSSA